MERIQATIPVVKYLDIFIMDYLTFAREPDPLQNNGI